MPKRRSSPARVPSVKVEEVVVRLTDSHSLKLIPQTDKGPVNHAIFSASEYGFTFTPLKIVHEIGAAAPKHSGNFPTSAKIHELVDLATKRYRLEMRSRRSPKKKTIVRALVEEKYPSLPSTEKGLLIGNIRKRMNLADVDEVHASPKRPYFLDDKPPHP